ncbi:hypothetical protein J1N35_042236 [Gossypium stocksii]|uniref:EamA domain-containing protein n=1 Tax=Gossypium stocksii TaxID=47602 RepID=A0A9D3UIY5_9ROSI|nr:hypothetical protein J1N35_042236 [Gossypium stocksii]
MYKLAADDGMNLRVIVVYRFMFANVIMVPFVFVFERKSLKKINKKVLLQAFFCGLFGGSLVQNLYLQSLVHTSATFVAAMINLAPAFTFILAICFKMEKLAIRTNAGKAKMCGTLIGIGGAMVFTFYRGVDINIWTTNVNLLKHHHHEQICPAPSCHGTGDFIIGAFFGVLSCISFSLWLIIQAKMSVEFPYLYSSTALMCLMASIQGALYAACTVRDWNQWKLGWNVRLLAVAYVGIMGSALFVFLVSWAVRVKGPLYAAIFNPLGLVLVAVVGSLLLDEKLHLGSIIGGLMIVCGVYVVLWGKAKESQQPQPKVKHFQKKQTLTLAPHPALGLHRRRRHDQHHPCHLSPSLFTLPLANREKEDKQSETIEIRSNVLYIKMSRIANIFYCLKPPLLMVLVQIIFAGINVMYKLAANDGMSLRVIVVYRFMFATVIMVPLALIFERLKLNLFFGFSCILQGIIGSIQNLYLQSLVHTSATFVAAMINLAPAFTFILAVCFKMEKLAIRTNAGKGKVCGTLIGIGGAMVFTFYKGVDINIWSTNVNLLKHHHHQQVGPGPSYHGTDQFIIGAFFGLLSCISFSLWLINQAKMSVGFPYLYSSTALMCLMGSIQGALYAVCTVRDWNQWKLGWNVRLLAVAFVGIMGSALFVFLVSWAVRLKGPLYAAIFNPLGLVLVAIVGSLLLDEKLHLGSIIGGLMIVCGVYVVLWGKAKEMKQKTQLVPVPTVDEESNEIDEDKRSENKETDEEQEHEGTETPPVIILA